jgi:hypothetical protein
LDAYATYTFHGSGSSVMPPLTTRCGPRAGLRLRKTVSSARPSARKSELETSLSARAAEYESELAVEQIDHALWRAEVEDDDGGGGSRSLPHDCPANSGPGPLCGPASLAGIRIVAHTRAPQRRLRVPGLPPHQDPGSEAINRRWLQTVSKTGPTTQPRARVARLAADHGRNTAVARSETSTAVRIEWEGRPLVRP